MVFMPNITSNYAITKTNNYNQTVIENEINVTLIETLRVLVLKEYQSDVLLDCTSVLLLTLT